MSIPSTMKAIKIVEADKAEIQNVPVPQLRDDYVLVKVHNVALNPTDWKHIAYLSQPGATVGCDFSGEILSVGKSVNKAWKAGDRIASFAHGANAVQPEDGCFAEYCVAKGDVGMKVPANLSDAEASTLGVGVTTVGQGLYQSLQLPLPEQGRGETGTLLVYGGSTATGSLAIQYARLSGWEVVTTCSERNFGFVKGLGAKEAFDYKSADCAKRIREFTGDKLVKAFDCISAGESPKICSEAIGSAGGIVSYLLPTKHDRTDVDNRLTLGYTVMGESFMFGPTEWKAKPEDLEFGRKFWELSEKLFAEGKVKVHPPQVEKGGLQGVFDGLKALREERVSGKKLVYNVQETS
ncbi:hypothetical protein MBLNU230_g7134t1 [Neophaeotheca triangularis]